MATDILQPGALVAGQFEIDRLIGSGGFARVYRATELDLGRTVALKVLSPRIEGELSTPRHVQQRFMREARLISRLQDPRTVTMYGYGSTPDGHLYMALEYIDGVDLRTLLKTDGPLDPKRIEKLIAQVLLALREAHGLDCLHRDIKPGNIMVYNLVGEPDRVKLLDFGIAKSVMSEHQLGDDLTTEGGVIGTPGYMSPEQLIGRPLTPASDLFSLGVVMYELYSGRTPYPSRDATEIYRRMTDFPGDLGDLASAPEPLLTLGRGLLVPDVEDRFQSADEVLEVLRPGFSTGTIRAFDVAGAGGRGRPRTIAADLLTPADSTRSVASFRRASSSQVSSSLASSPLASSSLASFPLGLDPIGGTPSTELTTVDPKAAGVRGERMPTAEVEASQRVRTLSAESTRPPRRGRFVAIFVAFTLIGALVALATWAAWPAGQESKPSAAAARDLVEPSPEATEFTVGHSLEMPAAPTAADTEGSGDGSPPDFEALAQTAMAIGTARGALWVGTTNAAEAAKQTATGSESARDRPVRKRPIRKRPIRKKPSSKAPRASPDKPDPFEVRPFE